MGGDPWPDGIAANHRPFGAFRAWAHERAVASRRPRPQDHFPSEVQQAYRIWPGASAAAP